LDAGAGASPALAHELNAESLGGARTGRWKPDVTLGT
jgi:hypothetical protein